MFVEIKIKKIMKKTKLLTFALIAMIFASCKKDMTCACSTSSVDSGKDYDTAFNLIGVEYQTSEDYFTEVKATSEISYEKVSGTFAKENCPTETITKDPYDYSYTSSDNFKFGKVGQRDNKRTCELK
jgi:hypothetical protein